MTEIAKLLRNKLGDTKPAQKRKGARSMIVVDILILVPVQLNIFVIVNDTKNGTENATSVLLFTFG